jgi:hypothetical protein
MTDNILKHTGTHGFSPVGIFACSFKLHLCLNGLEHSEHLNSFSPHYVCRIIRCLNKVPLLLNDFEHSEHLNNNSSPVCIFTCSCKRNLRLNDRQHSEHLNGFFSPVWINRCSCKTSLLLNDFGHSEHLKGFSAVCILICLRNLPRSLNAFRHSEHWCGFSPVCLRLCTLSWLAWANAVSHSKHLYGFSWTRKWLFKDCWTENDLSHWGHINVLPGEFSSSTATECERCVAPSSAFLTTTKNAHWRNSIIKSLRWTRVSRVSTEIHFVGILIGILIEINI